MELLNNLIFCFLCVFAEARGTGLETQKAVVHTILNRSEQQLLSVEEIVKCERQFALASPYFVLKSNDLKGVKKVLIAINEALKERMKSKNFDNVNHFHDSTVRPYWIKKMKFIKEIDGMFFYTDEF